jgi:hypothetical protein
MDADPNFGRLVFNRLEVSAFLSKYINDYDNHLKDVIKGDKFNYETVRTVLYTLYTNMPNKTDRSNLIQVFNAFGMAYSKVFSKDFLEKLDIYLLLNYEDKVQEINRLLQEIVKSIETEDPTLHLLDTEDVVTLWDGTDLKLKDTWILNKQPENEKDRVIIVQNELGIVLWIKLLLANQTKIRAENGISMNMKRVTFEQKGGAEDFEF